LAPIDIPQCPTAIFPMFKYPYQIKKYSLMSVLNLFLCNLFLLFLMLFSMDVLFDFFFAITFSLLTKKKQPKPTALSFLLKVLSALE